MDNEKACKNCQFAFEHKDEKNIGNTVYICRRNPPNVALLPTDRGIIQQNVFPVMTPDDWCHQYGAKLPNLIDRH